MTALRWLSRLYSDARPLRRTDWRTQGIPSPPSLLAEPEPAPPKAVPRNRATPAHWSAHRAALRAAFPAGWHPPRKLSREAMDALRRVHAIDPHTFSTPALAQRFRVSPEAVRRILRSGWEPPRARRIQLVREERQRARERTAARRQEEADEFARVEGERRGRRDRLELDGRDAGMASDTSARSGSN